MKNALWSTILNVHIIEQFFKKVRLVNLDYKQLGG